MAERILIVEDDPDMADLLKFHIEDMGYALDRAGDGKSGLEMALSGNYRLAILDVMLPGMDGMEVCRRLRMDNAKLPILMLTARTEEADKVTGLELGADDYVTKPFSIRELLARIKALIRRARAPKEAPETETLVRGGLVIDLKKRRVDLNGDRVEVTVKEFDLLVLLAQHPGRPYSREQLIDQVWDDRFEGYPSTVNSLINRLRSKIEHDSSHPTYIQTVWGIGYRFAELKDLGAG